jgi:signal transduction histidine kinase
VRSFTSRIVAQFAVLVTATMAVVLAVGGWLLSREAVAGLDLLNHAEFIEISDRLGPRPANLSDQEVDRRIRPHTEVDAALYFFQVHDASGRLLFRSSNLGTAELPDLTGGGLERTAKIAEIGEVRVCEFYDGTLHVQIASSLAPVDRLLRDYVHVSLLLLGGVAIASVGLGWGFARLTLRPVRAIHDTAARIRADNLGERIPMPHGRDELAALVGLLNRMFDRLEGSFTQVKLFTADASHELKTPLTAIRLQIEKLRLRCGDDPEATTAIGEVLEELERVRRITESLLFLAKAESGTFALTKVQVPADELVRDFADDARALAEDRGVGFIVARNDAGQVWCEPTLLRQLLLNLATNALRVSGPGKVITLDSILGPGRWRLVVCDQGPGLPPAQLERIFDRFQRYGPTSGNPGLESGTGLGLAICRSIATLHGGSIHGENRGDDAGFRVVVDLPIDAA